jgi:hypothetical protein
MNNKEVIMLHLNMSECQKLMMTTKPKSSAIYWRKMSLVTQSICSWLITTKLTAIGPFLTAASS